MTSTTAALAMPTPEQNTPEQDSASQNSAWPSNTAQQHDTAAAKRSSVAPFAEFLLVGGATLALFPLSWLMRRSFGLSSSELAAGFLTFYAAYVVNDPHFSVTYLLFYRGLKQRAFGSELCRAQRIRYWFAGFVGPLCLVVWAACALASRSAQALGWMIQLMFLLVGWHYVKQGFGVLSVLAARRGQPLRARERTALLIHCFVAWGYAWANPAVAGGEFEEQGVVYWAVPKPRWLELAFGAALALSLAALCWVLLGRFLQGRRLKQQSRLPLLPLCAFLITVWSWTIYSSLDPVVQYLIPALHSIQYLYFVGLLKGNEARAEEGPPLFGRPVALRLGMLALSALGLGWLLLRGVPTLLDELFVPRRAAASPGPLGATPFFAACFVVVNIHHYLMDSVLWRRDNPDMRFLRAASNRSDG